jgi:hypothetical protein
LAGCCECGDEPSGSGTTDLVQIYSLFAACLVVTFGIITVPMVGNKAGDTVLVVRALLLDKMFLDTPSMNHLIF